MLLRGWLKTLGVVHILGTMGA